MTATQLLACCSALCLALSAQTGGTADPLKDKPQRKREAKLRQELESPYRKWIEADVAYIITDPERQAFTRLGNDEERDQFIEQFWLRRDPTPDTQENEFKEEHYRRIAYANERFASGLPGWKRDRGRIYITYGPPDEIESHPSGGSYQRPSEQGGGTTATFPYETWRYRYIEGIGPNIVIEFVDSTMTGEYHMTLDPSEKDALQHVPHASPLHPNQTAAPGPDQFQRLSDFVKLQQPPKVKFRDLEAMVTSAIKYNDLPMKVRADFLRVTDSTVLVPVSVQFDNRDLQFIQQNGVERAAVNLYVRVTSMAGRVAGVQEDVITVEFPAGLRQEISKRSPAHEKPFGSPALASPASREISVYQTQFFLKPGTYRLNVVAKDLNGGSANTFEQALRVPQFERGKLAASSIILADLIENVPSRTVGAGAFVLGEVKVRPRVSASFRRDERMGFYFQVYETTAGEKTATPNGWLQYQVIKSGSDKPVFDFSEEMSSLQNASSQQVTVKKMLPLASFEPGDYTLKVLIKDRDQILTPTATFSVR